MGTLERRQGQKITAHARKTLFNQTAPPAPRCLRHARTQVRHACFCTRTPLRHSATPPPPLTARLPHLPAQDAAFNGRGAVPACLVQHKLRGLQPLAASSSLCSVAGRCLCWPTAGSLAGRRPTHGRAPLQPNPQLAACGQRVRQQHTGRRQCHLTSHALARRHQAGAGVAGAGEPPAPGQPRSPAPGPKAGMAVCCRHGASAPSAHCSFDGRQQLPAPDGSVPPVHSGGAAGRGTGSGSGGRRRASSRRGGSRCCSCRRGCRCC